jgi:hypothetical protein
MVHADETQKGRKGLAFSYILCMHDSRRENSGLSCNSWTQSGNGTVSESAE